MMRWIVESSLKYRLVVVGIAVVMMLGGLRQLSEMPVDVLPEFTPTMVEIQTEALGLSAAEVEQMITVPMEQDLLNGVAWLDDIRSESVPGLSQDPAHLRAWDRPHARPAGGARTSDPGACTATGVQTTADDPAPVVDEPDHDGPALVCEELSRSRCRCSPAGRSSPVSWVFPASRMWLSGGSASGRSRCRSTRSNCRLDGVTLLDVIETAGNALWVSPLTLPGSVDARYRRVHRHPQPAARDPAPLADQDGGRSGSGPARLAMTLPSSQSLRLGDVATVVEDHQPLIGDAVSGMALMTSYW